jgi:integrase
MLLSEFIEYFVELSKHDLRKTTIDRVYRPAFKSFLAICGDKALASYNIRDIETYKSKRLDTCSPVTFNIAFRTLKAAFNRAVRWELIKENPFSRSKQVRVPEKPFVHFTRDEFMKFIGVVNEPVLKNVFLFAVLTGMRQGEILNLQWSSVDLNQKLIRVINQEGFLTKTGRSRSVPMSDEVVELLEQLKTRATDQSYVFVRGREKLGQSYVEHKFKRYVRAAGLRDDLKFHSLRHTFATWLVQSGTSIYEIKELLGHSDITTTLVYAHLAASELHATVNRISLRLSPEGQPQKSLLTTT